MVEGGWPPSIPASCLLLSILQLGSVPWAQPLLSCPYQMQMPAQLWDLGYA